MKKIIMIMIAAALASGAYAEHASAPDKGQFYGSIGAVRYDGPNPDSIGYEDTDDALAMIIGYGLTDNWSVEILGSQIEADFRITEGGPPALEGEDDVTLTWLNFLYQVGGNETWQPFLTFGGGRSKYEFDGLRSDVRDNQYNAGFGTFYKLNDFISVRGDLRAVSSTEEGGLEPFAFIGLTGFIGEAKAPLPPADSDGDGVPNDDDQCPTTPSGRVVDATGCELDGDGDGVVDGDDRCPETPAGVKVDASGCALDGDGDGVPDYRDDCPDTSAGARVDDRGCYIELEEEVTIDMNIEFETNKSDIRPDHYAELSRAVDFLRQYPTANAVIQGHTDSSGAADYNQNLSEVRAEAVYDYLINEAGIARDRLSWAGFGESQPIASNDDDAGKQSNRRVTAVVAGTHKVRQ